jgi:predicted neuraminidase
MRDNGPSPKKMHMSQSTDGGMTWSGVRDSELPNPGAGFDMVTLQNGHWLMVYNDTERGRHSLAAAISMDEGLSWDPIRHIEHDTRGKTATSSHYPSVVQGKDGIIHVVYSYHHNDRDDANRKTIKYVRFKEAWVFNQEK